jgi:hypothetical protein
MVRVYGQRSVLQRHIVWRKLDDDAGGERSTGLGRSKMMYYLSEKVEGVDVFILIHPKGERGVRIKTRSAPHSWSRSWWKPKYALGI